jgi:hypothetical protein
LFTDFDKAAQARDEIRTIGFKDAFVVPYYNGVRITIIQARQMIEQNQVYTAPVLVEAAKATNQKVYESPTAVVANTNPQVNTAPVVPQPDIFEGDFSIPDLFFATQVGVYAKPRFKAQLFNFNELYYDKLANGMYRYYSGKHLKYAEAIANRNAIRAGGVADAFIVAFYNGKRIPNAQAQQLMKNLNQNPVQQVPANNNGNQNGVETKPVVPAVQPVVEQPVVQTPVYKEIVFKIQLGAYKNDIPVEVVNAFLKIADNGIERIPVDGMTIYMTGKFKNYVDAKNYRDKIAQTDVPQAFVVVYADGKKISIEEALKALEK